MKNFINNTHHINTASGGQQWFTNHSITYTYLGKTYSSRIGNYWNGYTGSDPDGNGIGNETYEGDEYPLMKPTWNYKISDSDHDGANDLVELEVYGSDPNNGDTDTDGLPDGWEIKYSLDLTNLWDASTDLDGDGLINMGEYQHGTNPIVADSDSDGMPDGWEVMYGLNPIDSSDASLDLDGDGLSSVREFWFGTDPSDLDTDGDGYSDGFEVSRGTDPLDPDDYPVSSNVTSSQNVSAPSIPMIYWVSLFVLSIVTIASLGALVLVVRRKSTS